LPPSMCPMPVLVPWSNGLVFLNISLLREIMQLHYLYRSLPLGCGEKKKTTVRDHLHLRICTEIYIRACFELLHNIKKHNLGPVSCITTFHIWFFVNYWKSIQINYY
jgi:hypothetical protein